jgi:hypothetical protein
MTERWCAAVAAVITAVVSVAAPGVARADNSNSNSNTNDVTQPSSIGGGDDAAASESTNWPPTDISWPPKDVMNGGVENLKGGNMNSTAPPIVMPMGQDAPSPPESTPSPTAKPIVPVDSP